MHIQPYLFFEGRAEEAIEFYRNALGAEVDMVLRMKDAPDEAKQQRPVPPELEDKIMHAQFRVGDTTVMLSDGMCQGAASFQGFSLSIQLSDQAQAERIFAELSEGGEVRLPLGKTFFSPCFGMLADRFGVGWMINVETK